MRKSLGIDFTTLLHLDINSYFNPLMPQRTHKVPMKTKIMLSYAAKESKCPMNDFRSSYKNKEC